MQRKMTREDLEKLNSSPKMCDACGDAPSWKEYNGSQICSRCFFTDKFGVVRHEHVILTIDHNGVIINYGGVKSNKKSKRSYPKSF